MASHLSVEIGLVHFPGAQLAAIHGLEDLFSVADRMAAEHHQDERIYVACSQWEWPDAASAPQRLHGGRSTDRPTVLILPPRLGGPIAQLDAARYAPWLIEQHEAGTVLCSVCGGAFLLAESGLLDGRAATTHWAHADEFRRRYPSVKLDADSLVIDDGDVVSAGGLMAWVDLGLKLVDRFLGPTVMAKTARFMLADPPGREQRFYSAFSPNLAHGDAAVLKVQHWLQATGARDMTLLTLAAHAGLEERTFLRRFRKATGLTAIDYCQRLRVGKARELLQFGSMSVDMIAWEVGYGDPSAFRKVFGRVTGLAPSEYRRRFSIGQP